MHPIRDLTAQAQAQAIALPDDTVTRRAVVGGMLRLGAAAVVAGGALKGGALGGGARAGAQEAERSGGSFTATAAVNLRSGPSTGHQVLRVVPQGGVVGYLGDRQNGFLYVQYDGQSGWVSEAYLTPGGNGPTTPSHLAYTTTDLNFRESPSPSGRIKRVLPRGTQVIIHHNAAPPYIMVAHNGETGWVHGDFLSSAPPTGGNPGGTPAVYLRVTTKLNLRAQPSTGAAVLAVMSPRAKVRYLGQDSNGFRLISYKGIRGWASAAYLA